MQTFLKQLLPYLKKYLTTNDVVGTYLNVKKPTLNFTYIHQENSSKTTGQYRNLLDKIL